MISLVDPEVKKVVFYHTNCTDGISSAIVAKYFLGTENVLFYPIGYRKRTDQEFQEILNKVIQDSKKAVAFVLDFSFTSDEHSRLFEKFQAVITIDHHLTLAKRLDEKLGLTDDKSFVNKQEGRYAVILRDIEGNQKNDIYFYCNRTSGALLSYIVFKQAFDLASENKQALCVDNFIHQDNPCSFDQEGKYIPTWIKYVSDRDLWTFHYRNTKNFHSGLSLDTRRDDIESYEKRLGLNGWSKENLSFKNNQPSLIANNLDDTIEDGQLIRKYEKDFILELLKNKTYVIELKTDKKIYQLVAFYGMPSRYISDASELLYNHYRDYDGTIAIEVLEGGVYLCSLRCDEDKEILTLAEYFGGGGHERSCGFHCTKDQWSQSALSKDKIEFSPDAM